MLQAKSGASLRRTIGPVTAALLALLAACSSDADHAENIQSQQKDQTQSQTRAMRIISLDYCADQFALKLLDRSRILAVSPDAQRDFSYMRASAKGIPQVRPDAENVLALKPDLIVRAYGGGPNAAAFFERAGVPVLNVGWAPDIAGVKRVIGQMAAGLAEKERGAQVIAQMNARLSAISAHVPTAALYMTPSGVTSGPGTLIHEMLLAAGLENYQSAPGWQPLPLEKLAITPPKMVAAAFFGSENSHKSGWSAARHPVARQQLEDRPTVYLNGAWTSCGGWYLLDAIEALARAAGGQNIADTPGA